MGCDEEAVQAYRLSDAWWGNHKIGQIEALPWRVCSNELDPCHVRTYFVIELCRGWAVSVTQVLLMSSPMSTIYKAVKERTSASFHLGLCAMGLVTSTMWTVYSMVSLYTCPLALLPYQG